MTRLSMQALPALTGQAVLPAYDRTALANGLVHLGTGAFHRAHQAVFTEACLNAGDLRWGITGASLRSAGVADQLNPQDGLYTVQVRDGADTATQVIGACTRVLVAPHDPSALVQAIAAPATAIITLTVTEKGYHLDPASGALNLDDPAIMADVVGMRGPTTAPGFLVAGLAVRRAAGLGGLTLLSCDNLPENGVRLADAVLTLAQAQDPALADWIGATCAFPSSMVDRIVPATTPDDIAGFSAATGIEDHGLVKTEPFSQWVIEDRFAADRPDWEAAGVQLTQDVRPWELAKLRLLNGAHSGVAYLGALAGHDFVHQAMADPAFEAFVDLLQDEAASTLSPPPGLDVPAYRAQLKARFANAALMHKTRQIAMDGSQKLPQRLLLSVRTRLDRGQGIDALALAVAGWMRWQAGVDEAGAACPVDDPLAATTRAVVEAGGGAAGIARGLVAIEAVFGPDLAADSRFLAAVTAALDSLLRQGARATVQALVSRRLAA
jgi:fructuronate reductase